MPGGCCTVIPPPGRTNSFPSWRLPMSEGEYFLNTGGGRGKIERRSVRDFSPVRSEALSSSSRWTQDMPSESGANFLVRVPRVQLALDGQR